MKRLLCLLMLISSFGFGQRKSVDQLIDIVPRYDAPYCTNYDQEEIEKFFGYYPKNKMMATMEDTTAIEKNVVFAEILDRDSQLRLDSGLVKAHLLKPGERLMASDSHNDFFGYFGDAFVIDVNGYYGMIVEKVMINSGKLTSEKYLCTLTRDGRLIDKISVLHSPEKDQSADITTKVCIKNANTVELQSPSGKITLITIDETGKIITGMNPTNEKR